MDCDESETSGRFVGKGDEQGRGKEVDDNGCRDSSGNGWR